MRSGAYPLDEGERGNNGRFISISYCKYSSSFCAIAAITVKDLLSAVMIFGGHTVFFHVSYVGRRWGAVDVAFTEASVSAGIGTILLIAALMQTTRRSKD